MTSSWSGSDARRRGWHGVRVMLSPTAEGIKHDTRRGFYPSAPLQCKIRAPLSRNSFRWSLFATSLARGFAVSNAAPDLPPMKEYKSAQYEFNDEQNREFSSLADAMRVTAGLMQLAGLAFVVLAAMTTVQAVNSGSQNLGAYGPAIGLGSAALLTLCVGFWTGGAATSFR